MIPNWIRVACIIFCSLFITCFSESSSIGITRSIFVDASVYLMYLPSLMNFFESNHLAMATEEFLENGLESSDISIESLHVMISSQSTENKKEMRENSTYFLVQANLQIMIRYPLLAGGGKKQDNELTRALVEAMIREHFTSDWADWKEMLQQQESNFFNELNYIELLPRTTLQDDDTFQQPPKTGTQKMGRSPNSLPENVLLVYAMVGVGIVVAASALLVAFCATLQQRRKQGSTVRGTILTSFTSEASQHPQNNHLKLAVASSCRNRPPQQNETPGAITLLQIQESTTTQPKLEKAPSEVYLLDDGNSTTHIQRIFSEDKVHSISGSKQLSSSIRPKRQSKNIAEDYLRESLESIIRQRNVEEDLELGRRRRRREKKKHVTIQSMMDVQKDDHSRRGTPPPPPPPPPPRMRREKSQWRPPSRNQNGDSCKSKPPKGKNDLNYPSSTSLTTKELVSSHERRTLDRKVDWCCSLEIASTIPLRFPPVISHTNDYDGCSVSTITGCDTLDSEESLELDTLSHDETNAIDNDNDGGGDVKGDTQASTVFRIGSDADDFGSIARSRPSSDREHGRTLADDFLIR